MLFACTLLSIRGFIPLIISRLMDLTVSMKDDLDTAKNRGNPSHVVPDLSDHGYDIKPYHLIAISHLNPSAFPRRPTSFDYGICALFIHFPVTRCLYQMKSI